jgi:hypothetical protein
MAMKSTFALLSVILGALLFTLPQAQGAEGTEPDVVLGPRASQLPSGPPPGHTYPEPVQAHPERPPLSPEMTAQDQPRTKARSFDPAQARRDAQELLALAQQIPPGVEQLSQNVLPKDLVQKLKRIEKLAKDLRREISR